MINIMYYIMDIMVLILLVLFYGLLVIVVNREF